MNRRNLLCTLLLCALVPLCCSCSKPLASARVHQNVDYRSRDYAASPNDIYYAARWALVTAGYSVASENLALKIELNRSAGNST